MQHILENIKGMAFDVDGVLSANTIVLPEVQADPVRTVNIKDGYALQLAVKRGMHVAIISGARGEAVLKRYQGLGVQNVFQGVAMKLPCYEQWLETCGLRPEETLFMGDDIPDYEVMRACGLPCCPIDAAEEIRAIAKYVSPRQGGYGCVRDIVEQVLKAQGTWMSDKAAFGW